jgi:hypothetical protein
MPVVSSRANLLVEGGSTGLPRPVKTRPYDNARRAAAAGRTQQRVVETAHRLLLERGYAGLAMADLAAEADDSVPLLYKVFGPKPQLVKRVYDVLLAGDVDPVPVAQRPARQAHPLRRHQPSHAGAGRPPCQHPPGRRPRRRA